MTALRPAAVLLDIVGTTTPSSFVDDTLLAYVRDCLPGLLARADPQPSVASALAEVRRLVPQGDPLPALLDWMAAGVSTAPLKTLQDVIWAEGFAAGAIRGALYPEVAARLRRWSHAGLSLSVFAGGTSATQRLLFRHSVDGDLAPLFRGFFDARIGGRREPDSYGRLAIAVGLPSIEVAFLSADEEALDAAAAAGLHTCQIVRDPGIAPSDRHETAGDLTAAAGMLGLP